MSTPNSIPLAGVGCGVIMKSTPKVKVPHLLLLKVMWLSPDLLSFTHPLLSLWVFPFRGCGKAQPEWGCGDWEIVTSVPGIGGSWEGSLEAVAPEASAGDLSSRLLLLTLLPSGCVRVGWAGLRGKEDWSAFWVKAEGSQRREESKNS